MPTVSGGASSSRSSTSIAFHPDLAYFRKQGFQCLLEKAPVDTVKATLGLLSATGGSSVDYFVRNTHSNGYEHSDGFFPVYKTGRKAVCRKRIWGHGGKAITHEVVVIGSVENTPTETVRVGFHEFSDALEKAKRKTALLLVNMSCANLTQSCNVLLTNPANPIQIIATCNSSHHCKTVVEPSIYTSYALVEGISRGMNYPAMKKAYPILVKEDVLVPDHAEYSKRLVEGMERWVSRESTSTSAKTGKVEADEALLQEMAYLGKGAEFPVSDSPPGIAALIDREVPNSPGRIAALISAELNDAGKAQRWNARQRANLEQMLRLASEEAKVKDVEALFADPAHVTNQLLFDPSSPLVKAWMEKLPDRQSLSSIDPRLLTAVYLQSSELREQARELLLKMGDPGHGALKEALASPVTDVSLIYGVGALAKRDPAWAVPVAGVLSGKRHYFMTDRAAVEVLSRIPGALDSTFLDLLEGQTRAGLKDAISLIEHLKESDSTYVPTPKVRALLVTALAKSNPHGESVPLAFYSSPLLPEELPPEIVSKPLDGASADFGGVARLLAQANSDPEHRVPELKTILETLTAEEDPKGERESKVRAALTALGTYSRNGSAEAGDFLVGLITGDALRHSFVARRDQANVRRAIKALGAAGPAAAPHAPRLIVAYLASLSDGVTALELDNLMKPLGQAGVEELIRAYRKDVPGLPAGLRETAKNEILDAMSDIQTAVVIPPDFLAEVVRSNPTSNASAEAIALLEKQKETATLMSLEKYIFENLASDPYQTVYRNGLLVALGGKTAPKAMEALKQRLALKETDGASMEFQSTFKRLKDGALPLVPILLALSPDQAAYSYRGSYLAAMGEAAIPTVRELLKSPDPKMRLAGYEALDASSKLTKGWEQEVVEIAGKEGEPTLQRYSQVLYHKTRFRLEAP